MDGLEIAVFGKVQGVAFRYYTKLKADELSLTGYVKNMPDGSVYIQVYGPQDQIKKFSTWCKEGSPASEVHQLTISSIYCKEEQWTKFEVIR